MKNPHVDPREHFVGAWNEHRHAYGYTLLAELPFGLCHALIDHPDLAGVNYDLLVVDEYQDLNACDLELLHLAADRGCSIVAAGHDDQSIYTTQQQRQRSNSEQATNCQQSIRNFPPQDPMV